MESLLSEYSFEELSTAEATTLKKSFELFKQQLEDAVFGEGILPTTSSRSSEAVDSGGENALNAAAELIEGTRILVFEDNYLNQRLLAKHLDKWDCVTFMTASGAEGMKVLETETIDLVLMDLRMPQMTGFEISDIIRGHENKAIRQLPIIALTADFRIQDMDNSELHGMNDYLLKPYSADALFIKILTNKMGLKKLEEVNEAIVVEESQAFSKDSTVSLDHLYEDCMGELDQVAELLHLFKQNVLEFVGTLKFQLKKEDFYGIGFAVHKIKSGLAMMRTDRLYQLVLQMEKCSKEQRDLTQLNTLFELFITEYPGIEHQLDLEFEKLTKAH